MQTHALPGHSASGNVETSVCADSDSAPQLSAAVTSEPTRMRASTASSRPSSSSSGGARYASGWTSPRRMTWCSGCSWSLVRRDDVEGGSQ